MFMITFASLATCMAVVSQGNLMAANSAMQVNRAHSAAETGLIFASKRLEEATARFVVMKGVIDEDYAHTLWRDGDNSIPPAGPADWPAGYSESGTPSTIAEAVRNAHLAEADSSHPNTHTVCSLTPGLPTIDQAGSLMTCPIALTRDDDGFANPEGPYFQLRYDLVLNEPMVRVTSVGVDNDIRRTLTLDFWIGKKVEYAVLTPNRIMIGKNVRILGRLGTRFGIEAGELNDGNGDPLVMRSDFYHLATDLDTSLDQLYGAIADGGGDGPDDTDNDNRLMIYHPEEAANIPAGLVDYNGDEFLDDWDLFLDRFDTNGTPGKVVYDAVLAAAAGYSSATEEFDDTLDIDGDLDTDEPIDLGLVTLIDSVYPDRDQDGIITPCDGSGGAITDCLLGYLDGILDENDRYAKVNGHLEFAVDMSAWEAAHEASYHTIVEGPIHAGADQSPVLFDVDAEDLREVTTDMVLSAQAWYDNMATAALGPPTIPPSVSTREPSPFEAKGAYDFYDRPVYESEFFANVRIPMGTNALFRNCLFMGVTYIDTYEECTDVNWNYTGAVTCPAPTYDPCTPKYDGITSELADSTVVTDTKPYSNNIRFEDCTFAGALSGTVPLAYTHWRNKVQFTGNTRFFIDPADPDLDTNPASNPTGYLLDIVVKDYLSGLVDECPNETTMCLEQLRKSSILLPGWSCDMGNFVADPAARVKLTGTILSGILDVRGSAYVKGTLLMTFRPVEGEGPLFYGGLPDAFNTTLGYFGPSDGDGEGMEPDDPLFQGFGQILIEYDPEADSPDGIPWPIRAWPDSYSYNEGGSS